VLNNLKCKLIDGVDPNTLTVDTSYQRKVSKAKVRKIAKNFNDVMAGVLQVSHRADGTKSVFEGQHRKSAAQMKNKLVRIALYDFTSVPDPVQEEAKLFVQLNKERSGLNNNALIMAEFCHGDRTAMSIVGKVHHGGFSLMESATQDIKLGCITMLRTAEDCGKLDEILAFFRSQKKHHTINSFKKVKEQQFAEVILTIIKSQNLDVEQCEITGKLLKPTLVDRIKKEYIGTSKANGKLLKSEVPDSVLQDFMPTLFPYLIED